MVSYPHMTYSILYLPFFSWLKNQHFPRPASQHPPPAPEDYTIVRPGFMGDVEAQLPEDQSLALVDDGGELKVTAIPHRSVAVSWWWDGKTGKTAGDR